MCHHDEGTVLVGGFAAAAVQVWVKHAPDPPSQLGFVSPLAAWLHGEGSPPSYDWFFRQSQIGYGQHGTQVGAGCYELPPLVYIQCVILVLWVSYTSALKAGTGIRCPPLTGLPIGGLHPPSRMLG